MIATLSDLASMVAKVETPLGTFRIGEDTPSMVGFSPIPKWDMTGNHEQPPEYKGPFWLQFVLHAPDYAECVEYMGKTAAAEYYAARNKEWRGRKWRISRHSTEREVVGTAFAAVMAAMEHEVRESFTWHGRAVFGPHIPLWALSAATWLEPDARPLPDANT